MPPLISVTGEPARAEALPPSSPSGLSVETVTDAVGLEPVRSAWTELADACGEPYALPGWALAWWGHARPEGAVLRTILVREGGKLLGVAPFFAERGCYRLLASPLSEPIRPVVEPGREDEVAAAIALELAGLRPRPAMIDLGTQWMTNDWALRLKEAWPGPKRPWARAGATIPVHVVPIEGLDSEGWLQSRSSKQRSNLRRYRRRLVDAGGRFRLADLDSLERDVATLLDLHLDRHAEDETPLCKTEVGEMLVAAGRALIPDDRLRLICLELEGEVIGARLMLRAGGEVTAWNSGFDNAHAKLSPSLNTFFEGVCVAMERGDRAIDLGPDTAPYKRRLADGERTLIARVVVPRGRGYLRTRARLALRRSA